MLALEDLERQLVAVVPHLVHPVGVLAQGASVLILEPEAEDAGEVGHWMDIQ